MSKRYQEAKTKVTEKAVDLATAIDTLKQLPAAKFDETVELHINLGIDHEKSDQKVRGSVTLPSGTPKEKKVVVLTEKLIDQIAKDKSLDADLVIATPDLMSKVAKVAKILGPKGLMPNPKTGTVTPDPDKAIKELSGGKISFKADQLGNIHESVGKLSWDAAKIAANTEELIKAIKAAKPPTSKGKFINKAILKSTMSPAIWLEVS